jgi:acylphosphatase
MPDVLRRRYVARGRVQGVGFRIYVLGVGRGLGLAGYVRNLADGRSVEAVAEGEPDALVRFATALREGPPGSYVSEFEEGDEQRAGVLPAFEIRP